MNQRLRKWSLRLAATATALALTATAGTGTAQAASMRKVTARADAKQAPAVKKGKTRITLRASSESTPLGVKFKAPSTKTYSLKYSNLRFKSASDRQRYGNFVFASADVQKPRKGGGVMQIMKIQGGYQKFAYFCSKEYYSQLKLSASYGVESALDLLNTAKVRASKSVKVKLKKGQTVYLVTNAAAADPSTGSSVGGTFTCDLTIR